MVSPITPPAPPKARIPEDSEYAFFSGAKRPLQVNFCKNPRCTNYGVPPAVAVKYARRAKAGAAPGVDYRLGAFGAGLPNLHCLLCKESIPLKSNRGVVEELTRLLAPFVDRAPLCCPRPGCSNAAVSAPNPAAYYRFGKTEGGSARYRCRACKKTFSEPLRATLRQREPRKNVPVLTSLMNKMPLTRITEAHGISPQTVYDKLDFFAKQAEAFAAKHERRLPEVVRGTKRYLAIDRQEYAVNWTHRKDRRNVVIRALGTADLETGFVYGMHINFDGSLSADTVEADAASCGDYTAAAPFRRYARLWLRPDYTKAVADSAARVAKRIRSGLTLEEDILKTYQEAEIRGDVESPEMVGAQPARHRPILHVCAPAPEHAGAASRDLQQGWADLVRLQRLPAGEHRQAADRLQGLLQLLPRWPRRHDTSHAPGSDQRANQPVRTPRPMKKAPSDGGGPWKGRFRPPRFNKLSEGLGLLEPFAVLRATMTCL